MGSWQTKTANATANTSKYTLIANITRTRGAQGGRSRSGFTMVDKQALVSAKKTVSVKMHFPVCRIHCFFPVGGVWPEI